MNLKRSGARLTARWRPSGERRRGSNRLRIFRNDRLQAMVALEDVTGPRRGVQSHEVARFLDRLAQGEGDHSLHMRHGGGAGFDKTDVGHASIAAPAETSGLRWRWRPAAFARAPGDRAVSASGPQDASAPSRITPAGESWDLKWNFARTKARRDWNRDGPPLLPRSLERHPRRSSPSTEPCSLSSMTHDLCRSGRPRRRSPRERSPQAAASSHNSASRKAGSWGRSFATSTMSRSVDQRIPAEPATQA